MNESQDSDNTMSRKGARRKKPSLKALESMYISKLKNSGFVMNISSDEENNFYNSEENDDDDLMEDIEKPKFLHENDTVHGEEIFRFQTRKQRDGLAQRVAEACNQKTPRVIRNKMKKHITAKLMEEDGSSGSEYQCSTSESESENESMNENSSNSSGSDSNDSNNATKTVSKLKTKLSNVKLTNKPTSTRTRKANNKYTINADEYFSQCSSSKIKTSNNTLDKLETPRLPQYQLQQLLSKMKLSKIHTKSINTLDESNKSNFQKWLYLLNENFNILLFGLGSKRNILKSFHIECLKDLPVIVVNGFFPTLSIKNILDGIIEDLLELKENPANIFEACDLIEQEFNNIPESHLYIIVHNIEGDMIRNSKAQNVLARLAAIRNIHLIASIDHINAPLIWDHNKLSKFNYIWWDVTSFMPYVDETSFERSMMVQKTGTLALSSLRNVFLSLTANSKSIYMIIVKHQLENGKNQYYQGLLFKDLYMACREAFIVSSDLALRAQLTEFVDHKMVRLKRSVDGAEYLIIPVANTLLQKFLDEHS